MLLKLNKVPMVKVYITRVARRHFELLHDCPNMPLTYIMFMYVEFILLCLKLRYHALMIDVRCSGLCY